MGYGNNEQIIISTDYPELNAKLAETASVLGGDITQMWNTPIQPTGSSIAPDTPLATVANYEALWEGLRTAFPAYITRESKGKDQSGIYDWWVYKFEPEKYEKTIILGCTMHGNEVVGQKVIYRLMYHVCYDNDKYVHMSYLRNKIRIIILPIQNPWGLANNSRYNSRSMDINRNFNYNWPAYVGTDKGSAAMSEIETQYIDSVLTQYSDTSLYLDFHNTEPGATTNYYVAHPSETNVEQSLIRKIIEAVKPINNPIINIQGSVFPQGVVYASYKYNIQAMTPEWTPGTMFTAQSSDDMTAALNFLGNLVIQYCQVKRPSVQILEEGTVIKEWQSSTTANYTGSAYAEITDLSMVFSPKVPGVIEVMGAITSHNTDATAITYLSTCIIQNGNSHIADTAGAITSQRGENEVYAEHSGKRGQLTVLAAARVLPSNEVYGDINIKFYWNSTVGTLQLRRSKILIRFTPSSGKNRLQVYGGSNVPVSKTFPADIS